jgi:hypothetical protein
MTEAFLRGFAWRGRSVLRDKEKRAAFIREAIEHEIQRREAEKKKR